MPRDLYIILIAVGGLIFMGAILFVVTKVMISTTKNSNKKNKRN